MIWDNHFVEVVKIIHHVKNHADRIQIDTWSWRVSVHFCFLKYVLLHSMKTIKPGFPNDIQNAVAWDVAIFKGPNYL